MSDKSKDTAAAQVGENWEKEAKFLQRELERVELRHRIELAASIERCAQVAEQIRNCDYQSMLKIASAIRSLKDAP